MRWQGLLADKQHRMGYGTTQDEDFIYLWHGKNGDARLVACFLYETARIKEIRDRLEQDFERLK